MCMACETVDAGRYYMYGSEARDFMIGERYVADNTMTVGVMRDEKGNYVLHAEHFFDSDDSYPTVKVKFKIKYCPLCGRELQCDVNEPYQYYKYRVE